MLRDIVSDELEKATRTSATSFDAVIVSTGRTSDKVGEHVTEAVSMEAKWRECHDAMCAALEKLLAVIDLLEDTYQQEALIHHYVCGLTWEATAEKMDYTDTWVYKLHRKALEYLETKEEPV